MKLPDEYLADPNGLRHHPGYEPDRDSNEATCLYCGAHGTYTALDAIDCPNGTRPYYSPQMPVVLAIRERDDGEWIARLEIYRGDDYRRDEDFERAMALLQNESEATDVALRLGAVRGGYWRAYSKIDGKCIGDLSFAKTLRKYGIAPQAIDSSRNICSIGFSEPEGKWYGWSHRALFGFEIGHVAKKGDSHTSDDDEIPVGFECKTLDDCKRCAIVFANSVS